MYEHHRLRIESALAVARRALFRAIEVAEQTDDHGLEDDLNQVNLELARLMADLMRPRATR